MTGFQPEIVIVNGFYKDGKHTASVRAKGIRIDLIPYQSAHIYGHLITCKTLPDSFWERLFRVGDTVDAILGTEYPYSVPFGVGYHTNLNIGLLHQIQPLRNCIRGRIRGVWHNRIVKIHHQQADASAMQILGRQLGNIPGYRLGEQGKWHIDIRPFIESKRLYHERGILSMPLYLAMTCAEITSCNQMPPQVGWLACHFSLSGPGLSNLPKALPPHSLLILDDSTPFSEHKTDVIIRQLQECISALDVDAVILDFQRPKERDTENLACILQTELPCPVAAPPDYGKSNSPLFLPPCPPNQLPKDYLSTFQGREVWLEAALDGMQLSITSKGCSIESMSFVNVPEFPYKDENLHCHYRIDRAKDAVVFSLQRTWDDLQELLEEAGHLGVTRSVGLWQELKK